MDAEDAEKANVMKDYIQMMAERKRLNSGKVISNIGDVRTKDLLRDAEFEVNPFNRGLCSKFKEAAYQKFRQEEMAEKKLKRKPKKRKSKAKKTHKSSGQDQRLENEQDLTMSDPRILVRPI
jgi:hypothetical protein